MSEFPAMSQSNLNYFLAMMGQAPANAEITAFGPWDSVSFFISNSQNPQSPTFKLIPVWGTPPPMSVDLGSNN